jgi:hypothetical protein
LNLIVTNSVHFSKIALVIVFPRLYHISSIITFANHQQPTMLQWILLFCSAFRLVAMLSVSSSSSSSSSSLPKHVMVVGATGRLGSRVVNSLLEYNKLVADNKDIIKITALVRDLEKASTLPQDSALQLVQCDLSNANQLRDVLKKQPELDAALWTAAGFTDNPSNGALQKVIGALKLKFFPKDVIDISALSIVGKHFSSQQQQQPQLPSVVMCSSAGVTRPTWSQDKKDKFAGAADIPIVRLNPLNILGVKRASEQALRRSGCSYTVLRPCGLNDKHPIKSRPVLAQGDVAVGRIHRQDVADLMVALLFEPNACGKTVEAVAIPGLPVPRSYKKQLQSLSIDDVDALDEGNDVGRGDTEVEVPVGGTVEVSDTDLDEDARLEATYAILQQLVPGDILAPEQLAMGQTYEQLSAGEEGRLGKRGEEQAPIQRDE